MNLFYLAISSGAATVLYFNYSLFGLLAPNIAELISGRDYNESLIIFFKIFAAAVWIKPIGSIIFGSIGDKYGRKVSLVSAGLITSLSTLFLGLFCLIDDIKHFYPLIVILIARLAFVMAQAGEIDGLRLYLLESVTSNKSNFTNGVISAFTQVGVLIASILINFSKKGLVQWQLCCIIGGGFGLFYSLLRWRFPESLEFKASQHRNIDLPPISLYQIFLGQYKQIIKSSILLGGASSIYVFNIIFTPTYFKLIGKNDFEINTISFAVASYLIGALFWGKLADRLKPIFICRISIILSLITYIMLAIQLSSNLRILNINYLVIAVAFVNAGITTPLQTIVKDKINIAIRYRIFSLSHSVGSIIFSAPIPFYSLMIAEKTNNIVTPFYLMITITLLLLFTTSKFHNSASS